jgi:hypothetical protein
MLKVVGGWGIWGGRGDGGGGGGSAMVSTRTSSAPPYQDWFRSGHPAPGYPLLIGPQWSVGFSPSFVHYPLLTNGEAGISPSPPPPLFNTGQGPPLSLVIYRHECVGGGRGEGGECPSCREYTVKNIRKIKKQ